MTTNRTHLRCRCGERLILVSWRGVVCALICPTCDRAEESAQQRRMREALTRQSYGDIATNE